MSRFFKIFLLVALGIFVNTNLSANDTFFSTENFRHENKGSSVKELVESGAKANLLNKFEHYSVLKQWVSGITNETVLTKLDNAFAQLDNNAIAILNHAMNKGDEVHHLINHEFGELLVKLSDGNTTVLSKISGSGWATKSKKLAQDLTSASSLSTFKPAILNNPQLIDAWEIIRHRSTVLRTNTDALEAISKIRSNPKFADFGLDDNLLGQLKGWGYGVDNGASFAEVITDLDRLLTNCEANSINITNFNKITDVLKAGNNANTKGMHWIIQDLADDVTTFNNKTITLEFTVPNARSTSSRLDVYCADCFTSGKRLLVEYKYGPTSITKQNIIKQFIERDLFNPDITSINQIQWRLKETGLTKTQLHNWLISDECRTAIGNLGYEKINTLFGTNFDEFTSASSLSQTVIDYFNNSQNFNSVFKY